MVGGVEEKIVRLNRAPLGVGETSLVIQAEIEKLSPQQVLTRDLLIGTCGLPHSGATRYVSSLNEVGTELLKEVLQRAADPADAFEQFNQAVTVQLCIPEERAETSW